MTDQRNFDVAIVGAGPTGAFLANALGQAGLRVAVIEREADIHQLPRAVHFDEEVMRALQAIGLADELATVARPSSKGTRFISSSGQTLLIRRGYESAGPHGWARNYYMHQPHFEEVLRRGWERYPGVEALLGHEVTDLRQVSGAVEIGATEVATGAPLKLKAQYVVGCDGARSFVRRTMGADSEDLGLHQPWLVVDVIVRPESPRVQSLPDYSVQLCDPARPMTMVYVGGRRRRWEIMLLPGDRHETIAAHESVWRLLSRWVTPEDAELERAALYTFHSVIARGWRKGRLLLAGDACHQTPPFLGQGMCAGIRDAHNLAWKLKAVLRDGAPDTLLDTYESERRPHVHAFIKLAVELGDIIQITDPERARQRDASFLADQPKMFDFPQPQLGPGARVDAPVPVGQVFPQPRFDDGARLDDRIGGRFALLATGAFRAGLPDSAHATAGRLGVHIVQHASRGVDAWLASHDAPCVLLRPDGYIYAVPRNLSDLATAFQHLDRTLKPASDSNNPRTPTGGAKCLETGSAAEPS